MAMYNLFTVLTIICDKKALRWASRGIEESREGGSEVGYRDASASINDRQGDFEKNITSALAVQVIYCLLTSVPI